MPILELERERYLTQAARDGSHGAMNELFAAYRETVVGVAYRVTLQYDDAQDVAQVVFLRAFRSFPTFAPSGSLRGWLSTVARNCAIDEVRRRKRTRVRHGMQACDESLGSDRFDRRDDDALLHVALASLPTKYRVPLDLFYFRELSYDQISISLGLPLNTLKTHMSRGRRRLKREYESLDRYAPIQNRARS